VKRTEIEQKFALVEPQLMRRRLAELGAIPQGGSHQIDVYYNHPCRDFLEHDLVTEWLRLREELHGTGSSTASINFKRWLPLDGIESHHCDEYESHVAEPEALRLLLTGLGFTELVTVYKKREQWQYEDVEIAIDEVSGLGMFTEFEYKGDGDPDQADTALTNIIKTVGLGLGERDRRGYPYLLLRRED
jgi:adenylate cyclase class 2